MISDEIVFVAHSRALYLLRFLFKNFNYANIQGDSYRRLPR